MFAGQKTNSSLVFHKHWNDKFFKQIVCSSFLQIPYWEGHGALKGGGTKKTNRERMKGYLCYIFPIQGCGHKVFWPIDYVKNGFQIYSRLYRKFRSLKSYHNQVKS